MMDWRVFVFLQCKRLKQNRKVVYDNVYSESRTFVIHRFDLLAGRLRQQGIMHYVYVYCTTPVLHVCICISTILYKGPSKV